MRKWALLLLLTALPAFAQVTVPASFFNQTFASSTHVGVVTTNGCRLWDSGVRWNLVNTSNGVYSWTTFDNYLTACANTNVILTLAGTPTFASSNPTDVQCSSTVGTGGCDTPSDLGTTDAFWKAFVTAAAQHWAGKDTAHSHYYSIWNEPNQDTTHSSGSVMWAGTVANIVTMTCDAYSLIHANDPQAVVIAPEPTFDNRYISSSPIGPANWTQQFFTAGGTNCVDAVALHYYPHLIVNGGGYYAANADPESQLSYIAAMKSVVSGAGKTYPVYVTEGNWGNISTLTTLQESAYILKWHLLLLNAGVPMVWWYQADNTSSAPGTCSRLWGGLWDSTDNLCTQGTAYNAMLTLLAGGSYATGTNSPCANGGDGTWICTFTFPNGHGGQWIWNSNHSVTYSVGGSPTCTNADQSACTITNNSVAVGGNPVLLTY